MPRSLAAALAALIAAAGAAPAFAAEPSPELAEAFARADRDGNGHLDVDEYVAAVVDGFNERDVDDDTFLTPDEVPEASDAAFAAVDRNGDGRLSLGEVVGDRMHRFFDADASREGVVTLQELADLDATESM